MDEPGRRRTRAALRSEAPIGRREAREAARRQRDRRSFTIAAGSTIIVGSVLAWLILSSPGWSEVQDQFFNPGDFADAFPDILKGFWLDVKLFVIIEACVLVVGLAIALTRLTNSPAFFPARLLSVTFVDVFRGVPTILLVYLIGAGIPGLGLNGLPTDALLLGGFALTLSYSAYVAEVYRAGINSVHRGQRDAALAIGLTEAQAMRFVILPQAIRRVGPPLLNDFISLQKDVALVSILGPQEAFRIAQIDASSDFIYTPLIAAAVLYLAVTIPLARLVDRYGGTGEVR